MLFKYHDTCSMFVVLKYSYLNYSQENILETVDRHQVKGQTFNQTYIFSHYWRNTFVLLDILKFINVTILVILKVLFILPAILLFCCLLINTGSNFLR